MMLLLTGAVSMNGQISDAPIMVVTGSMVNTGSLVSKGPIELRTNTEKNSQIDNTATGDIKTPTLTVDEFTLLNNDGKICVGCGEGSNYGNYATQKIGDTWWTTENIAYGSSPSDYYATDYNNGATIGSYTEGNERRGYYYSWDQAAAACASLGTGWHVPSKEEWSDFQTVYYYLEQADKDKWTNTPAFQAGYYNNTEWLYWNSGGYWWTDTEGAGIVLSQNAKMWGTSSRLNAALSVRCVKNS
ncbi:hypothetical protein FACS189440_13810 [Bacteroidia bacterium]|nr:hypothetical protein FACS189440_13810 [Bacteroidia bacterium]